MGRCPSRASDASRSRAPLLPLSRGDGRPLPSRHGTPPIATNTPSGRRRDGRRARGCSAGSGCGPGRRRGPGRREGRDRHVHRFAIGGRGRRHRRLDHPQHRTQRPARAGGDHRHHRTGLTARARLGRGSRRVAGLLLEHRSGRSVHRPALDDDPLDQGRVRRRTRHGPRRHHRLLGIRTDPDPWRRLGAGALGRPAHLQRLPPHQPGQARDQLRRPRRQVHVPGVPRRGLHR